MKVCVFGAGSLGSALGGVLSRRNEVTLVGRKPHMSAVKKNGLRLIGDVRQISTVETYESMTHADAPDLLIVSTKAYDTGTAVKECRNLVGPSTRVLTLQNGLGNLELLREWKDGKAFGGVTTMGAAISRPGVVRVSGLGKTTIGGDLDYDGASEIARTFSACGLPTNVSRNVCREIWGKAVINTCINPTATVLRVRNGVLLESDTTTRFMKGVCRECEQVAEASGIALPSRAMFARVRAVCRDTSKNISSMLQDVQWGRPTEIRQINGAFCREGGCRGIATPFNSTLVAMIESL